MVGGGGAFPILMYEYLIGIFVYRFRDDVLPIISSKPFVYLGTIIWLIWYIVYNYSGLIVPFGEMHNPFFGITLPWIVLGIAYSCNIKLKHDVSYGIYLYHMPIVLVMIDITNKNSAFLPMVWLAVVAVASVSCVFIEKPFMELKRKFAT